MNASALSVFDFNESPLRVATASGGLIWFVAADVCRVLELSNPSEALKGLEEDERMTLSNTEGHSGLRGGAQSFNVISESGLYALIFKSRKPEAKAFRKWVTGEVLPAIRKSGVYVAPEAQAVPASVPAEAAEAPAPARALPTAASIGTLAEAGAGQVLAGKLSLAGARVVGQLLDTARRSLALGLAAPGPAFARQSEPTCSDRSMVRVLETAANRLPCSTLVQMSSLYSAAMEAGYAADLMRDGVLTPGASRAVGRRLQNLFGRLMTDGKGRKFSVWKRRSKRGAAYLFRFEEKINGKKETI